ncbi:chloride channel protein CLC-e [Aristolochia californica]|uniref:chloride channel protein CLC-e n=1 Tax=Aristolochia californica TaxID=171875 RepID=UPI0035DAAECB
MSYECNPRLVMALMPPSSLWCQRSVAFHSSATVLSVSSNTCYCISSHGQKSVSPLPNGFFPFNRCLALLGRPQRLVSIPEQKRGVVVQSSDGDADVQSAGEVEEKQQTYSRGVAVAMEDAIPPEAFIILRASVVGLLTGVGVVIFNNAVHEIRDFFWDGIPSRGASWLREEPLSGIWPRVILVPVCGGVMVGLLNALRSTLENSLETSKESTLLRYVKAALRPFLKAVAASITLGTGNSLGPEGPSVEIGASIAKGIGHLFERSSKRKLSLVAAGSAAGISSGFNAAVAGCFFAVESVLWPSAFDSSSSMQNTTSMVILSAVIASVVSEVGLGSEPAFTVPQYDFHSPTELPLYLLLGVLCGLVSLALSGCTSYALKAVARVHEATGIDKAVFPVMGSLAVGLIALAYPEILYWGFENVDILLESRPFVNGLPGDLLFQLVGVKIIATSICRATGLVGGYYAPSLFIGAATGMAYGQFASYAISHYDPMFHLSFLEVASPQAYGLVGMAATLAGVCQVPLTSVLLLFELTQDYRIVLPLLGAVGLSSWITSTQTRKREMGDKSLEAATKKIMKGGEKNPFLYPNLASSSSQVSVKESHTVDLCEVENSLCMDNSGAETEKLEERISVSKAMRTSYVTVSMDTLLTEAIARMLTAKQSCALIVDSGNLLLGLVTLEDIQQFSKVAASSTSRAKVQEFLISEICYLDTEKCQQVWTITPTMNLLYAQKIMNRHGLDQLAVVSDKANDHRPHPVGLLDRECITLTCRALAAKELLRPTSPMAGVDQCL